MTARYRTTKGGNTVRIGVPKKRKLFNLRLHVFTRDDFTCQACGRRSRQVPKRYDGSQHIGDLTLGHILSHRDGGAYVALNLRAECPPCNFRKGARG